MRKETERIVYGKRNKFSIYLRKIEYKVYSYLRGKRYHKANGTTKTVVIYPVINDTDVLLDILNKVSWSFPESSNTKVYYSASVEGMCELEFSHNYYNESKKNKNYAINVPSNMLTKYFDMADVILVWDKTCRYKLLYNKNRRKVRIIDSWYFSMEECNEGKFGLYNILPQQEKDFFYKQTLDNYRSFKDKNVEKREAYIFVTGPTFSTYKELRYNPKSLKIVCNTIVKDKEFLDYIGGPDIICFADPAFHFSTNNYAFEFRKLVMECVEKYGSYIAVPQAVVPLMSYHYPQIRNKIIGFRYSPSFVIPCEKNLSVKPTGSVITFLMIPIAASFVPKIGIIGADGRQKGENYFWKHNDKVQLSDLMESVYETHPSFFRDRIYSNHYEHHCEEVRQIVELAEQNGIKVVAKTPSFVPCLKERYER